MGKVEGLLHINGIFLVQIAWQMGALHFTDCLYIHGFHQSSLLSENPYSTWKYNNGHCVAFTN